jgi:hypothetical protein
MSSGRSGLAVIYGAVVEVGADRGQDARARAPACQPVRDGGSGWRRGWHAGCADEATYGRGHESGLRFRPGQISAPPVQACFRDRELYGNTANHPAVTRPGQVAAEFGRVRSRQADPFPTGEHFCNDRR